MTRPGGHGGRIGVLTGVVLLVSGCAAGSGVIATPGVTAGSGSGSGPSAAATAAAWSADELHPGDSAAIPSGAFSTAPVWPFTTLAEAAAWRAAYGSTDHQAWHLDPARTALTFASDYLGFPGMDQVTSKVVTASRARVGVGWDDVGAETPGHEAGELRPHEAATVDLIRYGAGTTAPWVVVGASSPGVIIESPTDDAPAKSPLTVAGTITGSDTRWSVKVLGRTSTPLLVSGPFPTPAAGQHWNTHLTFAAGSASVVVVVVSTGGQIRDVDRFSVITLRTA
jgi:hypothetical protein